MIAPTYMHMVDGVPTMISYREIKRQNPKVSFPAMTADIPAGMLEDKGYMDLIVDPDPEVVPATSRIEYQIPVLVDGAWVMRNILVGKAGAELEAMKPELILRAEHAGSKKADEGYVHTNGNRYDSSELGMFRVTRALIRFTRNPGATISWKCEDAVSGDRVVHAMNATNMNSLADAIDTHLDTVQAAVEATVTKIQAGDFSATFATEYDAIINPAPEV